MKNSILAAIIATLALPAFAAVPAPLPDKGHVLILDNDELIEGDIERVGERFRIRQGTGELFIPVSRASGLVADREAAFQQIAQRLKAKDANDHMRLARWCLAHQLPDRAVAEADIAASMNQDVRYRMVNCDPIKRQAAILRSSSSASKAPPSSATPTVARDSASFDVNPESLSLFVTKIQPILMNACANCHIANHSSKFQLSRSTIGKQGLESNLAAVSAFLSREQPGASPLLTKAVSVHGGSGLPPIKDRQAAAYRHLEDWAFQAAGQAAAPAPLPASVAAAPALPAKDPETKSNEFASEAPTPVTVPTPMEPITPVAGKQPDKQPAPLPAMPTTPLPQKSQADPADPFDPAIFNQQKK